MWNTNAWRESDQDAIAEKLATAGSSEALGNHLGTKRQRRPSVRLGEIGDQPAASVAEKRKKQMVVCARSQINHSRLGDNTANSDGNETLECSAANSSKAVKALKTRHLVHVNNGHLHEHASSDDGGDAAQRPLRPAGLASSCCVIPAESWSEPHVAYQGKMNGKNLQQFLKIASKKGRNGNRKRGGPKAAASVKMLASAARSGIPINTEDKEKVSGTEDAKDMNSDEENDAHTPEGFRDCDLETSDYHNDAKEMSDSQESGPSGGGGMAPLQSHQEYQSRQVAGEYLLRQEQELLEKSKDKGGSANNWFGTVSRRQALELSSDIGAKFLAEASRSLHDSKAKLMLQENGNGESREPTSDNAEQHLVSRHSPLLNGVRGWLQDLGLGKYAQHFEAHEVDPEVLPLLTLDDLKEMGITAVGSRRKMFYAIQQFGKGLLAKAD